MKTEINKALAVLQNGGTILYPTDTVWGIGCDATNVDAVEKIFTIKKRSESKSLIVLVANKKMLANYVAKIPPVALPLIEESKFPLTIIYEKGVNLAKNILAKDGSVGIRISNDEFCKTLIMQFGKPIVSTSANFSGEPAPENFAEIKSKIKSSVDYIVKWKQKDVRNGKPSSIIRVKNNGAVEMVRK